MRHSVRMGKQEDFVLRALEERDVRFVRLWFTDVLGFLKSVAVAPAELEGAFAEGIGFDGSAIEGFARVYEVKDHRGVLSACKVVTKTSLKTKKAKTKVRRLHFYPHRISLTSTPALRRDQNPQVPLPSQHRQVPGMLRGRR